jgi:hypothetical protein
MSKIILEIFYIIQFETYSIICTGLEVLAAVVTRSYIIWDIRQTALLYLPPAFKLVSCSASSSILKMEAICSSETSVEF